MIIKHKNKFHHLSLNVVHIKNSHKEIKGVKTHSLSTFFFASLRCIYLASLSELKHNIDLSLYHSYLPTLIFS
jgi:hypothetical protein